MHTKEAVLAVTFLLLVHLTYTHFNPKIFPYREVFHSGKIPLDIVKEEHPAWYEDLVKSGVVKVTRVEKYTRYELPLLWSKPDVVEEHVEVKQ